MRTRLDAAQTLLSSRPPARVAVRRCASAVVGVAVLWAFALAGGVIAHAIGIDVPGSVVGMLLAWAALESGLVPARLLTTGAGVLLAVLGLLFVPAGVGVVQFLHAGDVWLQALAVVVVGSLLTLTVTGHLVQLLLAKYGDSDQQTALAQPQAGTAQASPAHNRSSPSPAAENADGSPSQLNSDGFAPC